MASDECWCETCRPNRQAMIVCPQCGNKRCPRATHHDNPCTGSNEPGQRGSSWENYPMTAPAPKPDGVDEYADVPTAPDTLAAKWEAMYCLKRDENVEMHRDAARHLMALAVANRALDHYARGNDGERARAAMEAIKTLVKGADRE